MTNDKIKVVEWENPDCPLETCPGKMKLTIMVNRGYKIVQRCSNCKLEQDITANTLI